MILSEALLPKLFFVNPNPGEAKNLLKSARQKMADRPSRLPAGKP